MFNEWIDNTTWLDSGGGSDMDDLNAHLDAELLALINADKDEEESFKLVQDDFEMRSDDTFYDFGEFKALAPEETAAEEKEAESEAETFVSAQTKKDTKRIVLLGIIGLLSTAAVFLAVVIVIVLLPGDDEQEEMRLVITAPEVAFHGANNVFINLTQQINNNELTLLRAVMDSESTAMFFDAEIDLNRLQVLLICDDGREHDLLPGFYPFVDFASQQRTTLRFQPFDRLVTGFVLILTDAVTNNEAVFSVGMEGDFHAVSNYLVESITELSPIPGVSVTVNNVIASTGFTAVEFAMQTLNYGERVVFGVDEYADSRLAFSTVQNIAPLNEPIMEYFACSGITVGRAYFAAVPNLRGTARLTFHDLGLRYDIGLRIPLPVLYENRGNDLHIEAGMYDVYLYHIISSQNNFRMVGHAINNHVLAIGGQDPLDIEFRREQMHIDAHMEIVLPHGEVAVIQGEVLTRQAGSDIIFDARPYAYYMDRVTHNDITVVINSVSFMAGTMVIEIDLESLTHRNPVRAAQNEMQEWFVRELGLRGSNLRVEAISEANGQTFAVATYFYRDYEGRLSRGNAKAVFDENGIGRLVY